MGRKRNISRCSVLSRSPSIVINTNYSHYQWENRSSTSGAKYNQNFCLFIVHYCHTGWTMGHYCLVNIASVVKFDTEHSLSTMWKM